MSDSEYISQYVLDRIVHYNKNIRMHNESKYVYKIDLIVPFKEEKKRPIYYNPIMSMPGCGDYWGISLKDLFKEKNHERTKQGWNPLPTDEYFIYDIDIIYDYEMPIDYSWMDQYLSFKKKRNEWRSYWNRFQSYAIRRNKYIS